MGKYGYKSDLTTDEKVLIAIVRLSELYKKDCFSIFKNYGITFAQYNVIRILYASENGQNTITRVSKVMMVSGANMTGTAKRLEKGGYLMRKRVPNDERITLLEITPKGKQTLKNISGGKDELIEKYLMDYSEDEKHEILSSLKKCLKRGIS